MMCFTYDELELLVEILALQTEEDYEKLAAMMENHFYTNDRQLPPEANGQAVSYLRWSSEQQSKGDSLRRQLELSEQFCTETGLILNRSLRDEGVSAYDKSNLKGAFGTFLDAVRDGTIPAGTTLIVESLDRLSRAKPIDALTVFLEILKAGIIIITLTDRQIYTQRTVTDDFSKLIISIVIMQRAHEESAMKSQRIGSVWSKKFADAKASGKLLTKVVPSWMEVVDGKIVLIPERAAIIVKIFEMAKNGTGQLSIAKTLNKEIPFWGRAGAWQESYIIRVLKNKAAYGTLVLDGQEVPDYYPAVMSRDEFMFVNKIRQGRRVNNAGNKKGSRLSNLFSGTLYCGYCGSKMVMNGNITADGENEKYIVCKGARSGATQCKCVNWDYKDLEQNFLFRFSNLNLEAMFSTSKQVDVDELERQRMEASTAIGDCKHKIENLYKALEIEFHQGLMERIKGLEKDLDDQQNRLELVETEIAVKSHASNSGKSRMSLLVKLFKSLKNTKDDLALRIVRESIQSQIKDFVEKIELFPTGPALNKAERDMRFMKVFFKSGTSEIWD